MKTAFSTEKQKIKQGVLTMDKIINDKDLECVNGGFGEGIGENDYDIGYKKGSGSEPDKPVDAGEYKVGIALDNKGNYKSQFDEENSSYFSFDIARK